MCTPSASISTMISLGICSWGTTEVVQVYVQRVVNANLILFFSSSSFQSSWYLSRTMGDPETSHVSYLSLAYFATSKKISTAKSFLEFNLLTSVLFVILSHRYL